MEKLGLNEIRKSFIEFFEGKGHYAAKSASLVPTKDKSLLLINSGMAPLKPYFSGLEKPPAPRMTTCQKCIRTGDIENVGKTSRHGTFFEMLGNFSFGNYFKKESLSWGWELITKVWDIPTEKLWVTVYEDDDEAYNIWLEIGVSEDRIVRLGKEDNFWEIGLGPCGPCAEIYFDRGEEYALDENDNKPGGDGDRFIEFWNHVFTQFSKEEDGSYIPLEHPNIDTGMGLERIACLMQGVESIFDIDTIRYILDGVTQYANVEYKDGRSSLDVSIRIITDHLRSMVFMIGDGIIPSNEGRGYVLRRLIRRAARHGRLLGINEAFLYKLAERVVFVSGDAYNEISEKSGYIYDIIRKEEERFIQTIDQGSKILADYIAELKDQNGKILPGDKAFKLYDTYGFPKELTLEILEEEGLSLDESAFDKEMDMQREKARKGRKIGDEESWKKNQLNLDLPVCEFIGYEKNNNQEVINVILNNGDRVETAKKSDKIQIFFTKTVFYPEGGGQIWDEGYITSQGVRAKVIKVEKVGEAICHHAIIEEGELNVGDMVCQSFDEIRRNSARRNHTCTHLLHRALKDVLGEHVGQAGSSVTDKLLRFDFSHFKAMTYDEIQRVEEIVNERILEFLPVVAETMSMDEAKARGAVAMFDEKYHDVVRTITCGDYSMELCGGTHVDNTGQIGSLKIISESGIASGTRRIEALTGNNITSRLVEREELIDRICSTLKATPNNIESRSKHIVDEIKSQKKKIEELRTSKSSGGSDEMLRQAKNMGDFQLICHHIEGAEMSQLRLICDELRADGAARVIFLVGGNEDKLILLTCVTDNLTARGYHAGKLMKELAPILGGKGGGKADMAQGGGNIPSKIKDAFSLAERLLS